MHWSTRSPLTSSPATTNGRSRRSSSTCAGEQGLTLATAESCTGGLIGARLTEVAGASDVFLGGVIAYSNEVKEKQLGVPNDLLREHGAVSAEVGAAMAAGAREGARGGPRNRGHRHRGAGRGNAARSPSASSFSPWTGQGEPTRRACSSLETGRPCGRGRPRWLCTHCGGNCRVWTRRGPRTGARVEGDERLRLFCALLLPPAAVDGLVAWQTAELAPRGESCASSPRRTSTSRSRFSADTRSSSGEVAEALREACAGHERPLFAVGRYRETRSVAMIALTDEGGRGERIADALFGALEGAISTGGKSAGGFRTSRSRAFATVRGSARRFPSSARSLRPTQP